ncbi:MAG: phosphopyruvate hydratase [Thermoproteota archaeon]
MSLSIQEITARKVFNNRGEETIEVDVLTESGFGRASAPAGKSRGKAEAAYYPPGGVDQAIEKVEKVLSPELTGLPVDLQEEIDYILRKIDGTPNFEVIGGNTAFAVSLATAEAAANSYGLSLFQYLGGYLAHKLPYPLGNVISGGKHGKEKTPDIQEFLVLPYGAKSFLQAMVANTKVHRKTGKILKTKSEVFGGGKSDEGAWISDVTDLEALDILVEVCEEVSSEVGFKLGLGVDVAASSLWDREKEFYIYNREKKKRDSGEQLEFIRELIEKYPLIYVEDPFHEEDFHLSSELNNSVTNCLICGDDLFVTDTERLSRGIKMNAANSIIIKGNQVGTLTDAWKAVELAKGADWAPAMSHRSGDTCDRHIAHLAVAFGCPIIKTGIVEGARIAKLNELIRIEDFLGDRAKIVNIPLA